MHRKGLSLIETLISLSIVGVALIALLPVMTVNKHIFTPSSGNENFINVPANSSTATPKYFTTDKNINIGVFDKNNKSNGLIANAKGFEYQGIPALYATNRLFFNTNRIFSPYKDTLLISSGEKIKTSVVAGAAYDANDIVYPMNAWFSPKSTIISSDTAADYGLSPYTKNDKISSTPVYMLLGKNYIMSGAIDNTNLYYDHIHSISNQNNEYIHVSLNDASNNGYTYSTTVNTSVSAMNDFNHISIGKNAIKKYMGRRNFISIFNEDDAHPLPESTVIDTDIDLAIGRAATTTATNTWKTPESFIISHNTNPNTYTINSNIELDTGKVLIAKSVILTSDKRLKTILGNYKKSLKEILKIKPVIFAYKEDVKQELNVGVIAQELRKIFPEAIRIKESGGHLLVTTEPICYALLNAIKELNNQNEQLEKENDELEQKIAQLKKIVGGKHE